MRVAHCYVVGSPIRHSRSPLIHRLFAEQCGLALRYDRREVRPGMLRAAVSAFVRDGVCGVNVTIPLKEEACALASERSPRAAAAGAANVLSFDGEGRIEADNTDGIGLIRDLATHGVSLAGRRVLLLGAGGAARGVLPALFDAGVATAVIANRTRAKADTLAATFAPLGAVSTMAVEGSCPQPFDLIVNATSAGLTSTVSPAVPAGAWSDATACYDLVYGSGETRFLAWARGQGLACRIDGLGMLVEQAAAAFTRWHRLTPVTAPVLAALRTQL